MCVCVCLFTSGHVGTSDAGAGAHPVHDEDLGVESLLKLFGSDRHRVEETEAPMDASGVGRMAATCV